MGFDLLRETNLARRSLPLCDTRHTVRSLTRCVTGLRSHIAAIFAKAVSSRSKGDSYHKATPMLPRSAIAVRRESPWKSPYFTLYSVLNLTVLGTFAP
jgi:hypothetical protein